jgi:hypothetical protein
MNRFKYLGILIIVYIIYRLIYNLFYNNYSETYTQITDNLKILYETLIATSETTGSISFTPSLSNSIGSYNSLLITPSRSINLAVTSSNGQITILPCTGSCINCVVNSITSTGCSVVEKT